MPQCWIGRFGQEDVALMLWPRRSPDLTPCNFSCGDNLQELRGRITAAVALIYRDMLTRVWNELDYRLDVCRISQCGDIEHL